MSFHGRHMDYLLVLGIASIWNSTCLGVYVARTTRRYLSRLQPFLFSNLASRPTQPNFFISIIGSPPRTFAICLVANRIILAYDIQHASSVRDSLLPVQSSHHACTSCHPPPRKQDIIIIITTLTAFQMVFDQTSLCSHCRSFLVHPCADPLASYFSYRPANYS